MSGPTPRIGHAPARRLLNFGCGRIYHRDWVNLDSAPVSPDVIRHDLRRGFPFRDETFDAVYGSHVLEHMDTESGLGLLQECFRVLSPGGIVRIAVPDLERIVHLYLSCLEGALIGDKKSEKRYDWIMMELYDQAVRRKSGGKMSAYLGQNHDDDMLQFLADRIGDASRAQYQRPSTDSRRASAIFARGRTMVMALKTMAASALVALVLGKEGAQALREGMFRRCGEVHNWMYDQFSLRRALEMAGFVDVEVCVAAKSAIPNFENFQLEVYGRLVRKPDSLFMEGRKNSRA